MKNETFKGTPGLWIACDSCVYAENSCDVADVYDGKPGTIQGMDREVADANALLIAAAPELLEAAQQMITDISDAGVDQEWPEYDALKAAVEKALGHE